MKFKYYYKIIFALLMIMHFVGCKSHHNDAISIQFSKQCSCVTVNNLSGVALTALKNDTLSLRSWQLLFPVCILPADTTLRNYQAPISGKYKIQANQIMFTPDTPFNNSKTYFARFYKYDDRINLADWIIKNRLPGKASYTELIFK